MSRIERPIIRRWFPMWFRWVLAGAGYGICMRALFGLLPEQFATPMSIAFLIATPTIVGTITSWGVESQKLTWMRAIFLPWLSIFLMLIGCAITLLEGSICIAMMAPLLVAFASLGGILGKIIRPAHTNSITTTHSVVVLPLLIAIAEPHMSLSSQEFQIVDSIEISAPPGRIWREILDARDIKSEELPPSISHLIGVPKPLEGVNIFTNAGEVRYSKWERGVNFKAKIANHEINKSISWHYEFDTNSFPKGSMDEHVAIGGRYFNLHDTTFNRKRPAKSSWRCRLVL